MAKIDFYYDSKKVNEDIENWRDIEIEVNFEDESGQGTIKSGALEFVGSLADKINSWNTAGMYGGPGIFEAPPFRIDACGGKTIFEGGINTAECDTQYECDKVVASLRGDRIDFMNDRASSFTFAYLASIPSGQPGRISQSDYVSVPYVINSIPDYVNVMVAGISLYSMVKELQEVGEKTKSVIQELTGDTTMVVGSLVNPIIATAMAIGRILADILRLVFYILYLFFIIQFIIALIRMIFDNLIQPVKYKKGMRVRTLFQKAADHLGIPFSSSLLTSAAHKDDVIIPRKIAFDVNAQFNANAQITQALFGTQTIKRKDYDDSKNPKSTGYYEGTFADLILAEEDRLDAEIRIIGGTLYFEAKEFFMKFSNYTLPNIARKNADPHGTNACELASNYIITYQLDDQETNTYDQYTGTSCQMQLNPNIVKNKRNILLKNLTEINLQYALAKRKTTLSAVEQVVSFLYDVADLIYTSITGFFNIIIKIINTILKAVSSIIGVSPPQIPVIPAFPPNPIQARIGMMLLSSDFIGVQKILVVDSHNKLHSNNLYLTAASTLMDELHFTNFAVRKITTNGTPKNDHNQWLTYTDKEIPFCCDDYIRLLNNNYCKTHDQKVAKIKSIIWKPERSTARITYRVKQQYTLNLNQKYIIDGKP